MGLSKRGTSFDPQMALLVSNKPIDYTKTLRKKCSPWGGFYQTNPTNYQFCTGEMVQNGNFKQY